MIEVEDLLKPVSESQPCGEDFTYHPSFQNLEVIARGKPETQFSPAEEPQWKEVRDAATEVLGQSKHLSAAVILTLSLLKINGLEGLRDGLAVVHGLVEKYWNDLYPKLDPEDRNDPTERLNILNNLSSAGEPYKFTVHVRQLVLCESPSMGRITLQQYLAAKEKGNKTESAEGNGGGASGPELSQIQAIFREAGPESAAASLALVNDSIGHAQGIDSFLDSTLGAGLGVNFEAINKLLGEFKHAVEPYAVGEEAATPAGDGDVTLELSPRGGQSRAGGGAAMSGSIQTRADVVKALDLICDYYRDNEPSSPVPLILQRAQRLVDKDFMEIMTDLTPEALAQLQIITGAKPKE
jgi:type VI secretion system protein ImpA